MSDQVHNLPTGPPVVLPPPPGDYSPHRDGHTPLVIDNGATTLRYGFCTSASPRSGLNVVSKYKERKTNKPILVFGEATEVESLAKAQIRAPWEGDVLLNFDALENALDYAFIQLGIDGPAVDHPVLMSERLCSPLHSRTLTSELMFELYSVPSTAYCVDSVMAFYQNNLPSPRAAHFSSDGLVVSFNTASTSVIPVLDGRGLMGHAKRIPWGASQASDYLLKLAQMKYPPPFPTKLNNAQTNWMFREFCSFAPDYSALLKRLRDPLQLRASEIVVQFPFLTPVTEAKSEEELARIAEKRREQGKKLQELAAKGRMEKLMKKETDLQFLLELRGRREKEGKREWANTLQNEGFDDDSSFEQMIKKLEGDLKKARKKETLEGEEIDETPTFPLVDVPDADLDEEKIKEKRKQKMMKAAFEARVRVKREKEREREERELVLKQEETERQSDLHGWAEKLKRDHAALVGKLTQRAKRRVQLSDRKSAAAQARMKSIASLAADERANKKKRKGAGEDLFGADDADWLVYRRINNQAASSDEEDDLVQLQDVEAKLLMYDPAFTAEHTHASMTSQRSALIQAFKPQYDEADFAGQARIHLSTERWRVCEAWFSPSMAGIDSAGLGEVMQNILARFSEAEKSRLVKNVFVTGGPSNIPGLMDRLHSSLRPILPPEMSLNIVQAADPYADAWKGMAAFARTEEFNQVGVTKEEYEEWGGERIKRWFGGNWNSSVAM